MVYIGYRFLFHFLIPVIITTRKVRKGFREMQDRMQQPYNANQPSPAPTPTEKRHDDDYIEFEELK
jgi:hypothetical protein